MKSSSTNGKGKISRRTFLANSNALARGVGALSGVTVAQDGQQNAARMTDKSKSHPARQNHGVPLLCHVSPSDQLQILDFLHRARSNFRAGWLPASH